MTIAEPTAFATFWAAYVEQYGDTQTTRVIVPWIIMMLTFWLYGGVLLGVSYLRRPSFITRRTVQPTRLPAVGPTAYAPSLAACVRNVLINQFLVVLPGLFFLDWLSTLGLLRGIRVLSVLPSWSEICWSTVAAVLSVEICFYYSHVLLHHKALYGLVHKVHHEFKAPYGIAALYSHWLEALLSSTFSVIGPSYYIGLHAYSFYVAMIVGWVMTISSHSGFFLPGDAHDMHHQFNDCNYGAVQLLDTLHGTYRASPKSRTA